MIIIGVEELNVDYFKNGEQHVRHMIKLRSALMIHKLDIVFQSSGVE